MTNRDHTWPGTLKLAAWIDELSMPFDDALKIAADLGVSYVWFAEVPGRNPIGTMTDAEAEDIAAVVAGDGLKLFQICANHPLHFIRLADLEPGKEMEHPAFRKDVESLERAMQIASRLGVGAVLAYGLSWPGEWRSRHRTWGKSPTWPMRWATQGGIISESDLDALTEIFSSLAEKAAAYEVDLVLGMRPFHFLSSTTNFVRLAERVASPRLRAMWSPADSMLSAESNITDAGFRRIAPYLHSLHLKDVHVLDGPRGQYQWCALGDGEVNYPALARQLIAHDRPTYLAVATHFRPPEGTHADAMRINVERIHGLIEKADAG